MPIVKVEPLLNREHLQYPRLACLVADQAPYLALLVQPSAVVSVSASAIGNHDHDGAKRLFETILLTALERKAQLVLTPEYSVPWSVLTDLIGAGNTPASGAIWALGCESISIEDALALKAKFSAWATVIHEDIDSEYIQPQCARYFNPLVYLFNTTDAEARQRLVMVVQFKTEPSGDPENTEAVGMARGKSIYLFEGPRDQVRLITFICSDVLGLRSDEIALAAEDSLVLHIQLNEKPRTSPYSLYRRHLFSSRCERTELICLNWAENITYVMEESGKATKTVPSVPASIWISRAGEFDAGDSRVEANHRGGLYYTRNGKEHSHVLNFNYKPAAFLISATKVKHSSVIPAGQSYRRGPELKEVLEWQQTSSTWTLKPFPIDDGFGTFCNEFPTVAEALAQIHIASPLAAERVVSIGGGEFVPTRRWYFAANLMSAQTSEDEVVHRVTATQDPDSATSRHRLVAKVRALNDIAKEIPFRAPLEKLSQGFQFAWNATSPSANVRANSDAGFAGTIVFAGVGVGKTELRDLYEKTSELAKFGSDPDNFCVVYYEGMKIKLYEPATKQSIVARPSVKDFTEPSR